MDANPWDTPVSGNVDWSAISASKACDEQSWWRASRGGISHEQGNTQQASIWRCRLLTLTLSAQVYTLSSTSRTCRQLYDSVLTGGPRRTSGKLQFGKCCGAQQIEQAGSALLLPGCGGCFKNALSGAFTFIQLDPASRPSSRREEPNQEWQR